MAGEAKKSLPVRVTVFDLASKLKVVVTSGTSKVFAPVIGTGAGAGQSIGISMGVVGIIDGAEGTEVIAGGVGDISGDTPAPDTAAQFISHIKTRSPARSGIVRVLKDVLTLIEVMFFISYFFMGFHLQ